MCVACLCARIERRLLFPTVRRSSTLLFHSRHPAICKRVLRLAFFLLGNGFVKSLETARPVRFRLGLDEIWRPIISEPSVYDVPYRRTEHAHPQRYCRRRRKPDWQSMTVASHSYPVHLLAQRLPSFFAGCLRVNSSDNLAELLIKISEHRHKAAHVLLHFGRHRLK